MKKEIMILMVFFLISFVSAVTIYSGESCTLELSKPYFYYSIVGNSTEVILDIVQEGNNVIITPNKYSQNDSYEIIFFDKEKEIITTTVYESSGGGGGTRIIYRDKNVTKYNDRVEYVDKEVTVPGEIEVEKIVKKTSWWAYGIIIIFGIIILGLLYLIFFKEDSHTFAPSGLATTSPEDFDNVKDFNTDERGYENNE